MSFLPQPFPPHKYAKKVRLYDKFEEEYYLQNLEELLTSPEFHAEFFSWYELVYKTELGRVCLVGLFSLSELEFCVDEISDTSFQFQENRTAEELCEKAESYSIINKAIEALRDLWACVASADQEDFLLGIDLILLYRQIDHTFQTLVDKKKSETFFTDLEKREYLKQFNFYRKELFQTFVTRDLIVSAYKKVPVDFPNQKGAFLRAIMMMDRMIYKSVDKLEDCRYLFCFVSKRSKL